MRFSKIETTFLPLHTGDGGESLRHSSGTFSQNRGRPCGRIRSRENGCDMLCGRLDAAFEGSADHTHGCDLTVAAGKHRPARRWNSRIARPRFDPGFDRYSTTLSHSSRLPYPT